MSDHVIAHDLGTGGNKASLFDKDGHCICSCFFSYKTHYPQNGWHEQNPDDWLDAVVKSTRQLIEISGENPSQIIAMAVSGHSLGAVPIDAQGNLLRRTTPIWSDARAHLEAELFFREMDHDTWYMSTGNGFPAHLYTIFKMMWYKRHEPGMFSRIDKILGTKDYVNYRLTGKIRTDPSYASGSGVYDLFNRMYQERFIYASGMPCSILPEIVPSTEILGFLNADIASEMGLGSHVGVACGGVDNSCMALGAGNLDEGNVYTALGSSAWIAVSSSKPLLDCRTMPYVFDHVIPGLYTSAVSIFSAGTTFNWLRDHLSGDLKMEAETQGISHFQMMDKMAEQAPVGSNDLLFNPSMAGGTSQDGSPHMRGALFGLSLNHEMPDLIRSCMEGIAMNLRLRLNILKEQCPLREDMLLLGGGSKSALYRRIFADVFGMDIIKTNVNQDATALGAAAIASVGCGLWKDFNQISKIHQIQERICPDITNRQKYERLLPVFTAATEMQREISDRLYQLSQ